MKIAYIGLRGVPAKYSGVEKAVEEIGVRLAKKGHKITIYCMSNRYKKKVRYFNGMQLKYIPTIGSKNLEMILYALFSAISCSLHQYDICHFHAIGPSTLSIIPKVTRKRIVATVHGLDWKRGKWGYLAKSYLKFGEWASSHFPHSTIVVSKNLQKYYEEKYKREVFYLPNGVMSAEQIKLNEARKKYGIKKNEYVLFVGRLTREKNVHLLINAFRSLKTDMKLLIVGGSSQTRDYIEYCKQLAVNDTRIVFTGPLYGEILRELYSSAFLFVLPSNVEGLPIVLLEALSYGGVVLVSDIPENLEIIKNDNFLCGFTFRKNQIESLKTVLHYLITNRNEVENLRNTGMDIVGSRYNWDKISEDTENLYKKLLRKNLGGYS